MHPSFDHMMFAIIILSLFRDDVAGNVIEDPSNQVTANTGCDLFELVVIAPDGTSIDHTDQRYEKQEQFRLITVDAAGFEVSTFLSFYFQ